MIINDLFILVGEDLAKILLSDQQNNGCETGSCQNVVLKKNAWYLVGAEGDCRGTLEAFSCTLQ